MAPLISGLETKDTGAAVMDVEHKTIAPVIEAHQAGAGSDAQGIVDAYVAVTGIRDDVGDIIEPGAFADTLARLRPKMCLGHDWNRPIGEPVEIEELLPGDPRLPATTHDGQPWPREAGALWTRSRYMLGTQDGRDAYEHANFYGPRTAYSIGYVPDKSKIRFTSEKGLRTRRLPRLDLYEYGPVLHGANALARQASIKSAQPDDFEGKVRLVRNTDYWGLPVGTPIRPDMKPRGPLARRLERAGKPVDPNKGVVEVDAGDAPKPAGPRSSAAQEGALFTAPKSTMRVKLTARGTNRRNDGTFESDIITLFTENPGIDPDSDDFEAYDDTRGVPDRQKVNKGEYYNPLDMLVANAVTPAELEDDLRNNSEWTSGTRAGEVADANARPEVDEFIDNVMDVYRERYNAALVAQHGKDLPDDVAELDQPDDVAEPVLTEKPAGTKRSTTSLLTMTPAELSTALAAMDDAELELHENELTARGADLRGKPSQAQQWIAAERERRAGDQATIEVPAETPPAGAASSPEPGTSEGAENAPEIEGDNVPPGDAPSETDGETPAVEDVPVADIPAEEDAPPAEEFEPDAVLGDEGRPVPRVPINDAGDFYDDEGNQVAGSSEFDQALNEATDAINDGDQNALADALAPLISLSENGDAEQRDITEPITPENAAVIAAEELADAQDIADISFGIHESEDGELEADSDIADRQERVAGLLDQAEAGALDLSGYDDDALRTTRADVLGEMRLQSHLEARRRQDRAETQREREAGDTDTDVSADTDQPEGEPPAPRPRPGVAGAFDDLADAIDDGDEERITATRARLEASARRSRSTSEHVVALRALLDSGDDLDAAQLRALAEAIRVETRAKRNASARDRRQVRRFERARLRALLSDVEAAMTSRGLEFDEAPEDRDGGTLSAGSPGAGVWTTKTEYIQWAGITNTVREVSGSHYRASVITKPDGRSSYEWEVQEPDGEALTGQGDTATADEAVEMIEIILDAQRTRGALPADTVLPRSTPRSASSALPVGVVTARIDAISERLSTGTANPLTGQPDPLRARPALRSPATRAFDTVLDVREYLLARVAEETDDGKRDRLASSLAGIHWDDVMLSPGGGLAVYSEVGKRGYHIMHTRSGMRADIPISGTSSANLPKADQVRIMAIMESVPDGDGKVIDFNRDVDTVRTAIREDWAPTDYGDQSETVARVFINEKLRSGSMPAGLLKAVPIGADNLGWNNRTNLARYGAVKEKSTALLYLIGNSKADKETRKTVGHGWILANAGAPDATAALYRRRAEELRQEFGAKAGDRGAILLDEIADNLVAMWAPEQSQGDRARALKAGERLTITEDDGVRNYRLLTDMRSTSDHARQSEAQVIDEATGATYRLGIWNDLKSRDSLTLWPDTKGGYDIWSLPLSGDEFAITGGDETAPDTADAVRNRARADIQSVPPEVLDAAANLLAESGAETEQRRATGARSRTDRRAPRRTAATPPEEPQPIPGEQHLAAAQGRLLPGWIGENYSESDTPAAGGFTSEQEWRDFIAAEQERLAGDYATGRGLNVIENPNYQKVTLSPGGQFIITSDHYVVHARSLQAVWGAGNSHFTMTGGAKLTAASSMAVAAHLERASLNGNSPDWTKGIDEIGDEVKDFVAANGNIVAPAARAAFQEMLATSKTIRISDIDAFEVMTRDLGPGFTPPHPESLGTSPTNKSGFALVGRYRAAGGARTEAGRERPYVATTKAGQTLAKKVEFEISVAESMTRIAPLDAARRLNRIADIVDGQTIDVVSEGETIKRDTLDPASDLRAIAKSITNAFDEKQITPAGMMLRNNMTGVVRGTPTIKAQYAKDQSFSDERFGNISEVHAWIDEDGRPHARFNDYEVVDQSSPSVPRDPTLRDKAVPGQKANGVVRVNRSTGAFSVSWWDVSGIYTTATFENWAFEPPADPDTPGGPDAEVPDGALPDDGPDRTEPGGATLDDGPPEGAPSETEKEKPPATPSAGQGELNRAVEQTRQEREGLRDLTAAELRERLDDARRRAATDASVQKEVRILRRELDAREAAEQDVPKAPPVQGGR